MIDVRDRDVILQRNGIRPSAAVNLGSARPSAADSQQAAALLGPMQTNNQARSVLGIVARYLQQGYQTAGTVPSFVLPDGTSMASKAMVSLLDTDNRYAMRVYAGLPSDNAPVSDLNRKKVTLAVTQALSSTKLVSTEAADLNRGLVGALMDLFAEGIRKLATDAAHNPLQALKWVGIGIVVLVGLGLISKIVHTVALGASREPRKATLGEAEAAAVAIMDSRLRKRSRS